MFSWAKKGQADEEKLCLACTHHLQREHQLRTANHVTLDLTHSFDPAASLQGYLSMQLIAWGGQKKGALHNASVLAPSSTTAC